MKKEIRAPKKSDLKKIADENESLNAIGLIPEYAMWSALNSKCPNFTSESLANGRTEVYQDRFFEEFCLCVEFLRLCKLKKTPSRSSYFLKHAVECWTESAKSRREYISNGAMVAAIIYLEIPYEWDKMSVNVSIGVSEKCPLAGRKAKVTA